MKGLRITGLGAHRPGMKVCRGELFSHQSAVRSGFWPAYGRNSGVT